jgi:uncharacterized protein (TIGR04255 family)
MLPNSDTEPRWWAAKMARPRHLPRPPITEALVDFRVKLPSSLDAESFAGLATRLRDDYPRMERTHLFQGGIRIAGDKVAQVGADKGLQGFLFRSLDGTRIAQYRLDGFTHNQLRPYTSWEEVLGETWRLWDLYRECALPDAVTRVAVRYINHFEIPASADVGHYLTDPPESPDHARRPVRHYLKRIVVEGPDSGIQAAVTQAIEPSAGRERRIVLLDIDAFSSGEYAPVRGKLEAVLDELRRFKNEILFGSLTEATVEMFE